jgi:hypothetical protein
MCEATAFFDPRRSLSKQIVERRPRSREFGGFLRYVSPLLGFEVITEIGLVLFAHFLSCGLFAMFGVGRVVLDAHLADVQLSVTRLTNVEPTKRQAKCG